MNKSKPLKSIKATSKSRRNKTLRRSPSIKGQIKSSLAKKKAARRVSNPTAKRALSKRHPKSPKPRYDYPRFF